MNALQLNLLAFLTSLMIFNLLVNLLILNKIISLLFTLAILILIMMEWGTLLNKESIYYGYQSMIMKKSFYMMMFLFITSEVLFFISFFWLFFHSSLSTCVYLGFNWPPLLIYKIVYYHMPLLNTMILLFSGVTITVSHFYQCNNNILWSIFFIVLTILLGLYFSLLQISEYYLLNYKFNDSVFSSCFFLGTGFHGFHVMVGTFLLVVNYCMMMMNYMNFKFHSFYELSIWYWHFVDVVWLFLFLCFYWWN